MGIHVALDELVVGGFHAVRGAITSDDLDRIEVEAADALRRFGAAGWLDRPRSYHDDPGPPDSPVVGRRRVGRTTFETLRFDSGWVPHADEPGRTRWLGYDRNARVRVLMLRHRGAPRPWVVAIHGAEMGGRPAIDTRILRAEQLHRRLGLNVVLPVLPLHGPRRPAGLSSPSFPGLDLLDDVHGLAQATWDIRRLLAWVRTQQPTGIGITGFSLGGYVAALVAGLEQPLDVVVAGCPAVDLPSLFRRNAPRAMRDDARFDRLMAQGDALFRVVSPLAVVPATPPERCYLYGGLVDRLAHPVEQVAELARHWGEPRVLWYPGGHVTHSFSGRVSRFVDAALRAHL
jgi:dienelactone hydrolase